MSNFVTFIIPSKGRAMLANTLCSLFVQKHRDWNAVVVFDAVEPTIMSYDKKIMAVYSQEKLGVGVNEAGNVRNLGIMKAFDPDFYYEDFEPGKWIGFVDDDDCLLETYIEDLKNESVTHPSVDCIVFRMQYQDGTILPPFTNHSQEEEIKNLENKVGISFAIKPHVFFGDKDKPPIRFNPSSGEDFNYLKAIREAGYQIHISNHITYNISPLGCAPDRRPKE